MRPGFHSLARRIEVDLTDTQNGWSERSNHGNVLVFRSMQRAGNQPHALRWKDYRRSKGHRACQRICRRKHCCMEKSESVRCKKGKHPRPGQPLILRVRLGTSCPGASLSSMSTASKSESIEPVSVASQGKHKSFKNC